MIVFSLIGCQEKNAERLVKINDSNFNIKAFGEDGFTVIFENGMGSSMDVWGSIPDSISSLTNVFLYDRAGLGKSDTAAAERTIPNMVEELRLLLKKEEINPPFIFVAHSMGTYIARYYAAAHTDEIKALLLIDPSPDKLYDNYTEKEFREFKQFGDQSYANSSVGAKHEWENYLKNRKYVQNESIPDQIPTVIVSATQWDFFKFHSGMMNKNKSSKHLKVEGSHDVHQEKPGLMVDLIKNLLAEAR